MISKNNYPIYVRWSDTIVWIFSKTERFPKNLRYSLSQKIDNLCLEILELIVITIYSKTKIEPLQTINIKLEVLRTLFQTAHKMKLISDAQYRYISEEFIVFGKMVGGWIRSA